MDIAKTRGGPAWRRPRNLWIVAAALALSALAWLLWGLDRAAPSVSAKDLWIDTARQGEMLREIRAVGTLVPRNMRWVTARATATVQDVLVEPGTRVEADTPILRLANPELEANLRKAEAALAGAEADVMAMRTSLRSQWLDQRSQLAQIEAEWRIAEVRAQANERAHAAGVISAIELRQSQITEAQNRERSEIERQRVDTFGENMAAQLQAARARRDEAASLLAIARQQVEALDVKAGIDGILQQVEVEAGQQVEMGAMLARVARPGELIGRLQVSEVLAKDLALDLPATIDTRNGIAEARVSRIDPAVVGGSVVVDVSFPGELPAGARPDLSVEGRIRLGRLEDVVSLARPPLAVPGNASSLFVLDADGRAARRVPVRYGAASSDRIEIVEGLRPGDRAILSDTSQWDDYDVLRLR
ncbi:HlyD family efflux transporter periplasmic adaptor subunit [Luteimonas aestuarii]|uniref:HlyD family efflux transporter periplasmic adaptor subunit n=1 Tax=Luteimonas aestuarii TaxID=453837 RepID=A0A4R5TKI3_9GAMM|nr:HlyD family efflux transporter periplasmic adaptor subunit [Luteimonas aestuarii]TDK22512.1 HlyD family efflux transporter periplasmic adaptor subunit [Luteimonas aestuarii]